MSDNTAIVIVTCVFILCVTSCVASNDYQRAHKCQATAVGK